MSPSPHRRLRLLAFSVVAGLSLFTSPALATFPGSNGKIVYTDVTGAHSFIAVVNPDGSTTPVTSAPATGGDSGPSWSPDGSKIVFSSTRDTTPSEIYVMNADGSNIVRLTTDANADNRPTFSPDGSKIAFTSTQGGNQDIWVMNADGTNPLRLTTDTASDYGEQWSPDGTKLVFSSERAVPGKGIYTMNADGTGQTGVYVGHTFYYGPTWSPDGSRIAAYGDGTSAADLVSFLPDGTDVQDLTNTAGVYEYGPTWSPDGTKIAYAISGSTNPVLTIPSSGGTGTPLTSDAVSRGGLQWQTIPSAPTVTTGPATGVTPSAATIAGTVNPQSFMTATSYHFEYGTSTSYGASTAAQAAAAGATPESVSASLSLLSPFTTYHYRLVATNGNGTTAGADMTFTTAGVAPAATTGSAVPSPTTATVNGTVDPMGGETSYVFQYGPTTTYSANTTPASAGATAGAKTVSSQLTGLLPGSTVHYRISATNAAGTANGADATLTTPKAKPTLSLKAKPTRDRTPPFVFRMSGKLSRPAGIPASRACSGSVTLKVTRRKGGKNVAVGKKKTVAIRTDCTYRTTLRPKVKGHGKLRISAKFLGNSVLKTALRSTTVRYG